MKISQQGEQVDGAAPNEGQSRREPVTDQTVAKEHVAEGDVSDSRASNALRLPMAQVTPVDVQSVRVRGRIVSGSIGVGDAVVALPSAQRASVARIEVEAQSRDRAVAGEAVELTLSGVADVMAGDILCHPETRAEIASQFSAYLVWSSEKPLLKGRPYTLTCAGQTASAQITDVKYRFDGQTGARHPARDLQQGETGICNLSLETPIAFDPHDVNSDMGSFRLDDRASGEEVARGTIAFALRRSHNIHWQALTISREQRAELKGQRACCLWFTGLSGAGKSTIANLLEKRLFDLRLHGYILDGDNVRHGLNKDLGFTESDRVENIRRVAEVARLMYDAGLITIVSFISPFRAERRFARERFPQGDFLEIFVDTPIEVCEERDPKGLYKKARAGQLANFTGINSPYEPPEDPEISITGSRTAESAVELIMGELGRRMILDGY